MLTSHLAIWIFLFSQTYKKLKCNKSLIIRFLCKAIYNIPLFNSKVHINSEISIWYHLSLYLLPSLLSFLLIPSFPPPSFSFSLDKENRVNHRRFLLIWNKNFFLTYVDESVQFLVGTHNLIWISPLDIGKCKPTKGTKNAKNVALNRLWKGRVFTAWELKQEGRASSHLTSAWERGLQMAQIVHHAAHVCKWPWKHEHWFWGSKQILASRQIHKY